MRKSSIKNRICVYKDGHRKYIDPSLVQQYLNNGYSKTYTTKDTHAIDTLSLQVPYDDLFHYYEILNHTKKDTSDYFEITLGQLNMLLEFYKIKKSTHNRGLNSKKGKYNKYGDENYNNRTKAVKTCLEKYNVDNPLKLESVREKTTCHETRIKAQQSYIQKTGKKVWNEGGKGLQHWVEGQAEHRHQTMVHNNSFNTSKP